MKAWNVHAALAYYYDHRDEILAAIYAALAYSFDNRQEIEDEFKKSEEWAEWVKTNIPSKIHVEYL